jgi:ubiquinone/menaquinone biosynthesis methyltransferase
LNKLKKFNITDPEEKKNYNNNLFSIVAPAYDIITIILSFGRDKFWKKKLISILPQITSPTCLDIASGTGDIADALSIKYPQADITGLDLNYNMIELAKKKYNFKNIKFIQGDMCNFKNIKFIQGDMCKIEFTENKFDIITGGYALRNAPDLKIALNEIFRLLKIGGIAVFLDFSKNKNKFLNFLQLFLLIFWGSLWGIIFHGDPKVYGYIAESLKTFPDRQTFKKMSEVIGFKNIQFKVLFFGFIQIIILNK